jgi:hypothetical protein
MNWVKLGVWLWGGLTVLLALASLCVVIFAGLSLNMRAEFSPSVPARLPGLYLALKENGSMVAGLLGFSGLAWVLFVRGNRSIG